MHSLSICTKPLTPIFARPYCESPPSPSLPNFRRRVKTAIPSQERTAEEKAALHNVTSSLYNRPEVKKIVESATKAICGSPRRASARQEGKGKDKKGKLKEDGKPKAKESVRLGAADNCTLKEGTNSSEGSSRGEIARRMEPSKVDGRTDEDLDEDEQELAISRFEEMLGRYKEHKGRKDGQEGEEPWADDEDESVDFNQDPADEKDPMEITSGEEEEDDYSDLDLEDDEDEGSDEEGSSTEGTSSSGKEESEGALVTNQGG